MIKNKYKSPNLPDYGIALLSCMGMLGFLVGLLIIFFSDYRDIPGKKSIFHEISYTPKAIVDTLLKKRIAELREDTTRIRDSINYIIGLQKGNDSHSKKTDSFKRITTYDTALLSQLNAYKISCSKMADTAAFKNINTALCFNITSATIDKWDSSFNCKKSTWQSDSVKIIFKDTKIEEDVKGEMSFSIKEYKFDIDFLTKYPLVGIWLLLILVFYSFCFMAVPIAIELKGKVLKIFEESYNRDVAKYGYYWVTALILMALFIFIALWLTSFYDKIIIKDIFFLCNLSAVVWWMTIIGMISGSFCLAGFIYTSSMLTYLSVPLLQKRKDTAKQKAAVTQLQSISMQEDVAKLSSEQAKLNEKENEQTILEMKFKRLSNIFQTYFILAASILSIMVLCTGTLFSATNSLDFIKLLADDWGYSPARNDFVYLYAGLYTIILLMVYVPAKMKFGDSEIDIWNGQMQKDTNQKSSVLKNPLEQFKGVLVAVSPLIVSIIQSLLDLIFQ